MTDEAQVTSVSVDNVPSEPAEDVATDQQQSRWLTDGVRECLDNPKPNQRTGKQTILVLAVTAFLFIGGEAFGFGSTGLEIAILVGVLLFHELGHLLAMRAFGFQDLRMFFLPFFGAAASGKKRDATGAQRAVVALAGPMPGIVLALVLCGVFLVTRSRVVGYAILTLWSLNLFNLLPMYPLDGGRFMDILLFSRWPALGLLVNGLLGVGLMGLAFWWQDWWLGIVGWMGSIGAFHHKNWLDAAKEAKAAVEANESEDAHKIPDGAAKVLAERLGPALRVDASTDKGARRLADTMNYVWELATQKRAGALATAALVLVYGIVALAIPAAVAVGFKTTEYQRVETTVVDGVGQRRLALGTLGILSSEVGLDEQGRFHGLNRDYYFPFGAVLTEGHWSEGYRDGLWKYFDQTGNLTHKVEFEKGKLISATQSNGDEWQDVAFQDLPQEWGLEEQQSFPMFWLVLPDGFDVDAAVGDVLPESSEGQPAQVSESQDGTSP